MAKLVPALQRLLDRGETFTGIGVEALMAEAGMSRRTFYVYFGDKSGFIREAATGAVATMMGAIDPWWETAAGMSRLELESSIATMFAAYEPHRGVMRAMAEAATYDETIAQLHDSQLGRVAEAVEGHIRAGQTTGAVAATVEPESVALWLTMMLSIGLAELPADDAPATRAKRLAAVTGILWRTLYMPGVR